MFRIAALNDSDSCDDNTTTSIQPPTTKEAKEAEAFGLYRTALSLQREGDVYGAEQTFRDLVSHDFLLEAAVLVDEEIDNVVHPGLQLLYSIHKNLAAIAAEREDLDAAMESYLEAVKIDWSEVTVWYKIGTTALKLHKYSLARLAFEQGLRCNENHWPCLDNLITVSYALNDYWRCLHYISKALEKDYNYEKGIALRDEMFREQPSLRGDSKEMFDSCDPIILTMKLDKEDAEEYIEEGQAIRRKLRELSKRPPPKVIKFPEKIKSNTWKAVGEGLIALYKYARNSSPYLSLSRHVDMTEYENDAIQDEPEPMDVTTTTSQHAVSTSGQPVSSTATTSTTAPSAASGTTSSVSTQPPTSFTVASTSVESKTEVASSSEHASAVSSSITMSDSVKPSIASSVSTTTTSSSVSTTSSSTSSSVSTSSSTSSSVSTSTQLTSSVTSSTLSAPLSESSKPVEPGTAPAPMVPIVSSTEHPEPQAKKDMDSASQQNNEVEMEVGEPCDVVDGDVKPKVENEQQEVKNIVHQAATLSANTVTATSEVLDESKDVIKSEITDFETKYVEAIAEQSVVTPEAQPAKSPVKMEVKPELEGMDEDGVEYSISGGLDMSPAPVAVDTPDAEAVVAEKKTAEGVSTDPCPQEILGDDEPEVILIDSPSSSDTSIAPETSAPPKSSSSTVQVTSPKLITTSPVLKEMLTKPPVSDKVHVSSQPITTHPLVAAQLISTPKSSLLLSTSMPPVTAGLRVAVPDAAKISPSGILSPVQGFASSGHHSAPCTPDILHTNPFSHAQKAEASSAKSQTLLSIALTQPPTYHVVSGTGVEMPKLSPSGLASPNLAQVSKTSPSVVQTIPLHSNIPKHISPIQGHHASVDMPHLSPEEKGRIAQHAAAHTLMALASMPTQVSPQNTSPGGTPILKQTSPQTVASLAFQSPAEVALPGHTRLLPRELLRGHGVSRRGAKRKRVSLPLEDAGMKRRSARVRNTSRRKQEDSINMQELLYKFLPSSLLRASDDDEDDDMRCDESDINTSTVADLTTNKQDKGQATEVKPLESTEKEDVKEFIRKAITNNGIIDLMFRFLTTLTDKNVMKWPEGLCMVFVQIYDNLRQHITLPDVFGGDDSITEDDIREYGRICLLWAEMRLDHWLAAHSKPSGTPPRGGVHAVLGEARVGEEYQREDLWYITTLAGSRHLMQDTWCQFAARVYWLKARLSMIQGDKHEADFCFDKLSTVMDCAKEEEDVTSFKLHNCKIDDVISKDQVSVQQESLQRSQSLEETQKLYEAGSYDKVVELLLQTFSQPISAKKMSETGSSLPERHGQLMLLQDSLFKLKDYKKCLLWGEVSFNEALQKYRRASGQTRDDWLSTISQIFDQMNKVLDKDSSILKSLPSSNTVRLSQNLIRMIELNMDSSDTYSEVANSVVLSWILLSRLIKSEEAKLREMLVSGEEVMDNAMSSSLMLLNVAHEYLGRQSWCTKSNGALLLYFLSELEGEMKKPHFAQEGLNMFLEQCIYCLYGHPNKKGRAKHLQDHNAPTITLDWNRAGIVFDYFKPDAVPEFDSYKANTVSTELENLLRRLFQLVPSDISAARHYDEVNDYINGISNTAPMYQTTSSILLELYYLLADYYFKNKEAPKAIKFYTHDLCVNSSRLDSWAGLALARMSQLEQKLSSMELKMDNPIHMKAIAALRCFQRAVELDETQRKLWIEYGSLAYQLHSHASRQLSMQEWFPLSGELHGIVKETRQEMLQVSQNCYWKASECEADGSEEEWLHHYMIGKVKEKKRCQPRDFLEHYRQAAIYLHEDEAFYPKKINYVNTPPKLAVEALEVFYRLHVVILKQLLKKEGAMVDYDLYQQYLTEAADSPFAKAREKKQERRESQSASQDESSSSSPCPPAYSQVKARPVYHMTPQDHTYSKKKKSVDGSDASSDAAKDTDSKSASNDMSKKISSEEKNIGKDGCEEKEQQGVDMSDGPAPLQKHGSTGFEPKIEEVQKASESDKVTNKALLGGGDAVVKPNTEEEVTKPQTDISSSKEDAPSDGSKTTEEKVVEAASKEAEVESLGVSEGKESAHESKSKDEDVLVLDPATGLMVPSVKNEEKMDLDDSPVIIQDDEPVFKEPETQVQTNSDETTGKSVPEESNDSDVILISDDESQSPKKMPSSLSLKRSPVSDMLPEPKKLFKGSDNEKPKDSPNSDVLSKADVSSTTEASSKPDISKSEEKCKTDTIFKAEINSTSDSSKEAVAKERKESAEDSESASSDGSDESDSDMDQHDSMDKEILHTELLDKCIDALHLCVQRFPTHYKSLYRLAHVYMTSPYHKNLEYARDLLLGNPNWQNLSHMPGPGLFAERKSTNLFNGIWKIPVQEIDRSGSFSSHTLRSVRLLLEVLREQRDVAMLLQLHQHLNRSPDAGKKYLRDTERNHLAKSSFKYIIEAAQQELRHWDKSKPHSKHIHFLMAVYKAWHHASHKLGAFVHDMKDAFLKVFKLVQKESIDPSLPLMEQATRFCQQRAAAMRPQSESNRSLSTSGFMSPPTPKTPVNTLADNANTEPQFSSPKHPGVFSPSPKKNQSPFSSPGGPGMSPRVIQSEASKVPTSQSDGSKPSSSQSEVSSASQSESDDVMIIDSPVSLTSAVQSKLHGIGVPIIKTSSETSNNLGILNRETTTEQRPLVKQISHCNIQREVPWSTIINTKPNYASSRPNMEQTASRTVDQRTHSKSKPRHPMASSINLKTVADRMKKKLKTALMSNPRFNNPNRTPIVGDKRKSNESCSSRDNYQSGFINDGFEMSSKPCFSKSAIPDNRNYSVSKVSTFDVGKRHPETSSHAERITQSIPSQTISQNYSTSTSGKMMSSSATPEFKRTLSGPLIPLGEDPDQKIQQNIQFQHKKQKLIASPRSLSVSHTWSQKSTISEKCTARDTFQHKHNPPFSSELHKRQKLVSLLNQDVDEIDLQPLLDERPDTTTQPPKEACTTEQSEVTQHLKSKSTIAPTTADQQFYWSETDVAKEMLKLASGSGSTYRISDPQQMPHSKYMSSAAASNSKQKDHFEQTILASMLSSTDDSASISFPGKDTQTEVDLETMIPTLNVRLLPSEISSAFPHSEPRQNLPEVAQCEPSEVSTASESLISSARQSFGVSISRYHDDRKGFVPISLASEPDKNILASTRHRPDRHELFPPSAIKQGMTTEFERNRSEFGLTHTRPRLKSSGPRMFQKVHGTSITHVPSSHGLREVPLQPYQTPLSPVDPVTRSTQGRFEAAESTFTIGRRPHFSTPKISTACVASIDVSILSKYNQAKYDLHLVHERNATFQNTDSNSRSRESVQIPQTFVEDDSFQSLKQYGFYRKDSPRSPDFQLTLKSPTSIETAHFPPAGQTKRSTFDDGSKDHGSSLLTYSDADAQPPKSEGQPSTSEHACGIRKKPSDAPGHPQTTKGSSSYETRDYSTFDVYDFAENDTTDERPGPGNVSMAGYRSASARPVKQTYPCPQVPDTGDNKWWQDVRDQPAVSGNIIPGTPGETALDQTPKSEIVPDFMALYEFISDEDTGDHALTIDMDK